MFREAVHLLKSRSFLCGVLAFKFYSRGGYGKRFGAVGFLFLKKFDEQIERARAFQFGLQNVDIHHRKALREFLGSEDIELHDDVRGGDDELKITPVPTADDGESLLPYPDDPATFPALPEECPPALRSHMTLTISKDVIYYGAARTEKAAAVAAHLPHDDGSECRAAKKARILRQLVLLDQEIALLAHDDLQLDLYAILR